MIVLSLLPDTIRPPSGLEATAQTGLACSRNVRHPPPCRSDSAARASGGPTTPLLELAAQAARATTALALSTVITGFCIKPELPGTALSVFQRLAARTGIGDDVHGQRPAV